MLNNICKNTNIMSGSLCLWPLQVRGGHSRTYSVANTFNIISTVQFLPKFGLWMDSSLCLGYYGSEGSFFCFRWAPGLNCLGPDCPGLNMPRVPI